MHCSPALAARQADYPSSLLYSPRSRALRPPFALGRSRSGIHPSNHPSLPFLLISRSRHSQGKFNNNSNSFSYTSTNTTSTTKATVSLPPPARAQFGARARAKNEAEAGQCACSPNGWPRLDTITQRQSQTISGRRRRRRLNRFEQRRSNRAPKSALPIVSIIMQRSIFCL